MGGKDIPKEPVIFMKPHSSLVLPGEGYKLPQYESVVHHETELGFMIGKGG
jgi:2-keto-4-pentenoate hydratase/2-oxohepta-3-ene-1,7-dioic acid hydratase in catechol pathway